MSGPLRHLRVLDLSASLPSALATLPLADLGADVLMVEPPGGSSLRRLVGYPLLGRGKHSIELDLQLPSDAEAARALIAEADVVVSSLRDAATARLGLDYASVSAVNPRLVYASISGWGPHGPLAASKGYEALVLAKVGAMWTSFQQITPRPGPTFCSVPYASWSAGQSALAGVFAALVERETSGLGQQVQVSLAEALAGQDPYNQANAAIVSRFPGAFSAVPRFTADGLPNHHLAFRLLVALTADGHWLQFSQTQPRHFRVFMEKLGLAWMFDDPAWKSVPDFPDIDQRLRFWDMILEAARTRTLAEWQELFAENDDVFAEIFRRGTDVLHHPQVVATGGVVVIDDPVLGPVRQPAPIVAIDDVPLLLESAPALNDRRGWRGSAPRDGGPTLRGAATEPASPGQPLSGMVILELGSFFAGPFGATVLTDLGARVIKIEPLDGEPLRTLLPFPEAGAMKVLQGKESVVIDFARPEGRELVERIAGLSTIALCSFRAGVAERLGLGPDDLQKVNPDLTYVYAPGYGTEGPYGRRPAFAPTMSAGGGLAGRNAGDIVPDGNVEHLADVRARSVQMMAAAGGAATQPDGIASAAVASALALAAYLARLGHPGQVIRTSMLHSTIHAMADQMVEFDDKPPVPTVGPDGYGLHALYRLYETSSGWVFLAAPAEREWHSLVSATPFAPLAADSRFADESSRAKHDAELGEALAERFATRPAVEWERDLLARDVGCVVADERTVESNFIGDFGREHGYLVTVDSPIIGEYERIGPLIHLSRSQTTATVGCTLGQHTAAVLTEIGLDEQAISELLAKDVISVG
ncbi:CoA transferase [Jatrophihabitans sp.]|uniref:CaiB/BaiF CoA transferase family protein n=1 Tax=Jatrophihabitans sp. TaxID=1932789 RepID=UPI0030C702D7|nr:hypothetical protein [Jatrophihabitans sp.]